MNVEWGHPEPTEPGFYGVRLERTGNNEDVVEVRFINNILAVCYTDGEKNAIEDMDPDCDWTNKIIISEPKEE